MNRVSHLLLAVLLGGAFASAQEHSGLRLWYDQPAHQWVEALPLGNGRLGAMVFGQPGQERLQLNELTVWAGGPYSNDNPRSLEALPAVRALVFAGKYTEARKRIDEDFITKIANDMPYQTVGNLLLTFPGHDRYSAYHRELDLERAVATTSYKVGTVVFKREVFCSFPDQVIVVRLTASRPDQITFDLAMDSPETTSVAAEGRNRLVLNGKGMSHQGIAGAIRFAVIAEVRTQGGNVTAKNGSVKVDAADTALVYISIGTNFRNYTSVGGDALRRAEEYLSTGLAKPYSRLMHDHVAYYKRYFDRVRLDVGHSEAEERPTDIRLAEYSQGNDPQLAALYFQFGRYLLISSSQPGGQPATLQGLWNESLDPPWGSKYTTNINTEMNYWPSEVANLEEMNEPLVRMIEELSTSGSHTARTMYGARGWVLHHNTDLWRATGPIDGSWGEWPTGGAWLCQHLWERYAFSGDTSFLRTVYPVLRRASEFFVDFLVPEPTHGWLVVCPSTSPENAPAKTHESTAAGCTLDNQLVFDLMSHTIRAAEILHLEDRFIDTVREKRAQLPPMQVGRFGQLQEWMVDWDSPTDRHRHVSHLYGLYPSNQISPFRNPELFDAARTSLLFRGDVATGWSMAWKMNLWARLLDGNHAYKLICDQLRLVASDSGAGGTYPNLFDAHPPFQIDGNFGCTAGIAEMLLQSQDGAIQILPALPDAWKDGSFNGLRARGGFEVGVRWTDGRVHEVSVISTMGGVCRLRSYRPLRAEGKLVLREASDTNPNPFYRYPATKEPLIVDRSKLHRVMLHKSYLYEFDTAPGGRYQFRGL
jgi:alpha-L-fucosidase 2